jgi:tRNA (cytidine/uridine-2'-O-)-methyltransferase
MGFAWDDKRVRRTAMDYIDHVAVRRHAEFEAFRSAIGPVRLVLFTTKTEESPYDFQFSADDVLLFGQESAGVPTGIRSACDHLVRLPIRREVRSLNLASAVALGLGEALRQTGGLPR